MIAVGTPVAAVDDRAYDFSFLETCGRPKLFVSGARDQFGPRARLEQLVATLPEPKRLVIIEGADHFFAGRLAELRKAIEEWVQEQVVRSQ
jgi:alpha/beta superfamily hydrolase